MATPLLGLSNHSRQKIYSKGAFRALSLVSEALDHYESGDPSLLKHIGRATELQLEVLRMRILEAGFWFVDIPRTSSTYIKHNLSDHFGFPFGKTGSVYSSGGHNRVLAYSIFLPDHTPGFLAQEILGDQVWSSIQKFSVVRNPRDWCWSLWRYTVERHSLGFKVSSFNDFLNQFEIRLDEQILLRPPYPTSYMQSEYLTNLNESHPQIIVDHILRFEDRESINAHLADLGVVNLMHHGSMSSRESRPQISKKEDEKIQKLFEQDFNLFGYSL